MRPDAIDWSAVAAALVTLWFYVSAAYAGWVGLSAIRTREFAPRLGLEIRGMAASVAGCMAIVLALALAAAGALVSYVELRG